MTGRQRPWNNMISTPSDPELSSCIGRQLRAWPKTAIIKLMNSQRVTVNVTNRTIVRTILWVVATIILYKFIGRISHGLTLIFASFFLAMALNPVVSWMSRRLKIESRIRATAAAYLMVIVVVA